MVLRLLFVWFFGPWLHRRPSGRRHGRRNHERPRKRHDRLPERSTRARSQVKIIPDHYDPLKDTTAILLDTTNDSGKYVFAGVPYGTYTLQSLQCGVRTRAIAFGIVIARDTVSVASLELQKTGRSQGHASRRRQHGKRICVRPRVEHRVSLHGEAASAVMDSVPAGLMPSVNYGALNSTSPSIIRFDVRVLPGDTTLVAEPDWKYSKQLFLNTTASGAAITGNVMDFPVLVRLMHDNFIFSQAAAGGADLRFTKPDGAQLPYEIERYDPVTEHAEVWVSVDTVFGSDSSHYVYIYWGNSAQGSTSISNSAAVFDTAIGFQGVWHFCRDREYRGKRRHDQRLHRDLVWHDGRLIGFRGHRQCAEF